MERHWFKKYQPRTLEELDHTPQVTGLLKEVAKKNNFPHILIYGPAGTGKYLRAICFVNQIFQASESKVLYQEGEVIVNQGQQSEKIVNYKIGKGTYHSEINVETMGRNDVHIIHELMKGTSLQQVSCKQSKIPKILVIRSGSKLSKLAQGALRATMQKQSENIRLIIICENIHDLIAPIKSRCLNIRLKGPTAAQMESILNTVYGKTKCKSDPQFIKQFGQLAGANIRKAINYLQVYQMLLSTSSHPSFPIESSQQELNQITNLLFDIQTLDQSTFIKQKLLSSQLLKTNIRQIPLLFFSKLLNRGLKDQLLRQMIQLCAKYQPLFDPSMSHYSRLASIMTYIEATMILIKTHNNPPMSQQSTFHP